jgi:hypothetical protein
MVEGSCHSGKVRIAVETAPTDTYVWGDRMLALHRCADCGCVTHWSPSDPAYDRMGINARLLEPAVLAAARVKQVDGASFGGTTH